MPYVPYNYLLDRQVSKGNIVDIPYPKGKTEGSFFGSFNHTLTISTQFFRSPGDFVILPKHDVMQLKWLNSRTIPAGEILHMNLEELGMDSFFDERTGVTLRNTFPAPMFMISFKSPTEAVRDYYLKPTVIKSSGTLPITTNEPDVPRSVKIFSTANDADRTFRIEGEDVYNRTIVEELSGPDNGFTESKKAFAKINRVIASGACAGEISIGLGIKLGFPVFMPSPAFVIKVIYGGKEISGGTIIAGDVEFPTATSPDRRGLYIPPSNLELDGNSILHMLVILPNPGNIGSPDFTG